MDSPGGDRHRADRRHRILDRVIGLTREHSSGERGAATAAADPPADDDRAALEQRVAHLEAALEGLQDEVYRDAQRHERELAELRKLMRPENLARELNDDARRRGL